MKKIPVLLLAFLMLAMCLTGCGVRINSPLDLDEGYSVGDTVIDSPIDSIKINWSMGDVILKTHEDDSVVLTEECKKALSDEDRVHWKLDGKTLVIRYAAKKDVISSLFEVSPFFEKKTLTLTLPASVTLKSAELSTASANVFADALKAEKVNIATASGGVFLEGEAGNLNLVTSSGKADFSLKGHTRELNATTASGKITGKLDTADSCHLDSSSGDIDVTANGGAEWKANTSSGSISLTVFATPDRMDLDSSSGSVTLNLPEDASFTAKVDTASGRFDSDFALVISRDSYVAGTGDCKITLDTSSGDIGIYKNR